MLENSSTSLVIVGATGDLSRRNLLPGLFQLGCKGRLPANFRVVGMARSQYSEDEFREFMWREVRELGGLAPQKKDWNAFAPTPALCEGGFTGPGVLHCITRTA